MIGLDIVEIDRIERLARRNPRFLTRVFSPRERRYCRSMKNPWRHFAARFAAKEAVWKALDDPKLGITDISVSRDAKGRPGILLKGRPAPRIHVSLSHDGGYAVAVALCRPGNRRGER